MLNEPLQPHVFISQESTGVYDIVVNAMAPNSCYEAQPAAFELPPGFDATIPEMEHLVCHAKYTGGLNRFCLMALKPLRWDIQDASIGTGKNQVAVHVVVNGAIVGTSVVALPGPSA